MIITRTYRFNPKSLWEEFRCEFEDGRSADKYLREKAVNEMRARGIFICFGEF